LFVYTLGISATQSHTLSMPTAGTTQHVRVSSDCQQKRSPYLHLAASEMWCWSGGREYWKKTVSVLQYCVLLWWCTKVQAALTGRLTVSGFDLAWFSSLCSQRLVSSVFKVLYILFLLTFFLYLLASWAWWHWALTCMD